MRMVLAVALLFCESSGSSSELNAPPQLRTMAQSLQERAVGCVGRRADRERVPLQQCAGCRKPLIGDRVLLNGVGYHAACLKCHECRHPLGDQPFVVTENLRFHSSCFFCHHPGCGVPLADAGHYRFKNKTLCRNHYEEVALGRCVKCDSPLRGEFVSLAHKSGLLGLSPCENKPSGGKAAPGMCRKCFQCAHCKTELIGKKFYEHEGKPYCQEDYEQLFAPKCAACARALWGKFKVHESGETYCIPCEHREPSCFSCGRLVWARRAQYEVQRPVDLPDGRVSCEECSKVGVVSPSAGLECFRKATHFVQWLLGRETSLICHLRAKASEVAVSGQEMEKIDMRLVDRTEMSTLCLEHSMHGKDCSSHAAPHTTPMGITLLQKEVVACSREVTALGTTRLLKRAPDVAGTIGSRTVTRAVKGICALTALPPMVLTATLVHELLHFHMFVVGNFRTNPPDVEEGICELAAVLYLRSLPQDKDRDMRIRQSCGRSDWKTSRWCMEGACAQQSGCGGHWAATEVPSSACYSA